jgi:hypothetical protein
VLALPSSSFKRQATVRSCCSYSPSRGTRLRGSTATRFHGPVPSRAVKARRSMSRSLRHAHLPVPAGGPGCRAKRCRQVQPGQARTGSNRSCGRSASRGRLRRLTEQEFGSTISSSLDLHGSQIAQSGLRVYGRIRHKLLEQLDWACSVWQPQVDRLKWFGWLNR